ncbi:MAG: RcnB family protein [Sphingomonas sp.]|jgi:Ni/Co efflux regulator RcnB|uniref:RcnB family protein n=1 Tax=Sphingomonas sp. TaxID=28214 RepID=UPI003563CA9B
MKKLIFAALAATIAASPMIAVPAVAAPQERHTTVVRHERGRTVVVKRTVVRAPLHRNWRRGERFDYRQARNYRVINDWRSYRGRHLYAPPRGYHWVRSGNDAVLVAVAGGVIGAVLAGAFN